MPLNIFAYSKLFLALAFAFKSIYFSTLLPFIFFFPLWPRIANRFLQASGQCPVLSPDRTAATAGACIATKKADAVFGCGSSWFIPASFCPGCYPYLVGRTLLSWELAGECGQPFGV